MMNLRILDPIFATVKQKRAKVMALVLGVGGKQNKLPKQMHQRRLCKSIRIRVHRREGSLDHNPKTMMSSSKTLKREERVCR